MIYIEKTENGQLEYLFDSYDQLNDLILDVYPNIQRKLARAMVLRNIKNLAKAIDTMYQLQYKIQSRLHVMNNLTAEYEFLFNNLPEYGVLTFECKAVSKDEYLMYKRVINAMVKNAHDILNSIDKQLELAISCLNTIRS